MTPNSHKSTLKDKDQAREQPPCKAEDSRLPAASWG